MLQAKDDISYPGEDKDPDPTLHRQVFLLMIDKKNGSGSEFIEIWLWIRIGREIDPDPV